MNKYKEMSVYELQQIIETEPLTKRKKKSLITLINKKKNQINKEVKSWLNSPLFKQFFYQFKNIKGCFVIYLVVDVLLRISQPSISSWHFNSCSMNNLPFDTCSS